MEKKQSFKALSKICLNNWHYIDRKILSFNEGINFFTGHSGSGKSTVIDAMQIVLYANTDGRGFFNKAAADDSDRSLIEYLRGMVNIGDNNEAQYLRNKNFSSTIVMEMTETGTDQKQCIGVVFDVETSNNEISRLFFWHRGGLLENDYRADRRCLSTMEIREYLQRTFSAADFYCGPSNERFRRQMYNLYLGGLDMEKFPRLFRRAIPFKMNIKLEDFVKEYICMEQDIHIDDLQESVTQYGRMRRKIEETMDEVRCLEEIAEKYAGYEKCRESAASYAYQIECLEIMQLKARLDEYTVRREELIRECSVREREEEKLKRELEDLQKEYEHVLVQIAESGYAALETELIGINESLERLENILGKWQKTEAGLNEWKDTEVVSNQILWDIERFADKKITESELGRLKVSLGELADELEEERHSTDAALRAIKKEEKAARDELKELKQGRKAYPKEVEEARYELRNRLYEKLKKPVNVQVLADLLDIRDEKWHNAVEGYLGNNKLLLVVDPEYAKDAMEIYRSLDRKRFYKAAVLDTEKVMGGKFDTEKGSLAEEVDAKGEHVRSYINFFLGHVMKCDSIEELREHRIGITSDCVLYHSFRLQHINPENYTRRAYIGETSMRMRIRRLEERCAKLQEERLPLQESLEQIRHMLEMEFLNRPLEEYMEWAEDIARISVRRKKKEEVINKMKLLREESIEQWEKKKNELMRQQENKKEHIRQVQKQIWDMQNNGQQLKTVFLETTEKLTWKEKSLNENKKYNLELEEYLKNRNSKNYEYLKSERLKDKLAAEQKREKSYQDLVETRSRYIREYPNRTFSTAAEDNEQYEKLLETLSCADLEKYREAAREQAAYAVAHFKEDFIYKIRSAIREAYQQKDELNRIISRLDFGKDKYQFVITKNKGPDGKYYRMFMDESLEIRPSQLKDHFDSQMDLFTMEHEEEYGEMMNELIQIFIPPENATREELEAAKRNMDKYSDYRTYLSFDMQQIIHGEKEMKIGLSRMIKKNSGGEGQNPLYIALLASFAQIYKISLPTRIKRPSTLRLVVLDEAFSKMDAEKVASCISLIRGLGFQAIISATNDKIQNYIENVDKTFVYANPNKRHISIQEFERQEFDRLTGEDEE